MSRTAHECPQSPRAERSRRSIGIGSRPGPDAQMGKRFKSGLLMSPDSRFFASGPCPQCPCVRALRARSIPDSHEMPAGCDRARDSACASTCHSGRRACQWPSPHGARAHTHTEPHCAPRGPGVLATRAGPVTPGAPRPGREQPRGDRALGASRKKKRGPSRRQSRPQRTMRPMRLQSLL